MTCHCGNSDLTEPISMESMRNRFVGTVQLTVPLAVNPPVCDGHP